MRVPRARPVEQLLWWMAAVPATAVIVVGFGVPLLQSLAASFVRDGRITLANYELVYRLYGQDVVYTVLVAAAGLVLTFGAGIPLAGYLRLHAAPTVEFLLKIPLFVPFVVVGHAMRIFLAPRGTLLSVLHALGLISPDASLGFGQTWLGLAIALAWKHLALIVLLLMGAFRAVDESYLEAARGFGAGTIRQIWAVLVPMSASSLALAAVLALTSMLASFSIPLMMSRGSGPQMLMIDLYYRFGQHGDFGVASALGVVSYLLASGAAYYYLRTVSR
ncbi:MAG: sugar ABC transporter permease [Armatimonadota bacterium]|nr:sugar ABC transporter permease [Armatimonadota bacterium]